MFSQLRPALSILLIFTVLTGVLYPALVTAVAQLAFPHQANGSLIEGENGPLGSTLVGQSFTQPKYFWGRLSSTSGVAYNAGASSGSNLGPMNPQLLVAAEARLASLSADPSKHAIPVDLVTSSGSGLDPHISPAAAKVQVARVAKERNVTELELRKLISQHTESRQLGFLGEPRVNVLQLNLALDQKFSN